MSTRSGKRIHSHISLLEDTALTEQEPVVKSERKSRSKRTKENLEDLSVSIFKNKKRNNYVAYPTEDEVLVDAATKKDHEIKQIRVSRKNALKDQNPVEDIENIDTQKYSKNLPRKSRRGKRLDDPEETENQKNVLAEVTELPKSTKSKKKKKEVDDSPATEEAPAKKSKKKKKKGKKTNSIIVEDALSNDNKFGALNKSNMSIDSFHSAAGSPEEINEKNNEEQENNHNVTLVRKDHAGTIKFSSKTNKKLSNNEENETLTNDKGSKKIKSGSIKTVISNCFVSMTRDDLEKHLENINKLSNKQLKKKSKNKDATLDKNNSSTNIEEETDSNVNVSNKKSKRRKSNIQENISMNEGEPKNNNTFEKRLTRTNSVVKDLTFDKSNASVTQEVVDNIADTDLNVSNKSLRTKSVIKDNTFDKTSASITNDITDKDEDVDLNISNISKKHLKARKSVLKDSTFDKSGASITNDITDKDGEIDLNVSIISKKHLKARKSILKDSTFDKSSASITNDIDDKDGEIDLNVSNISKKHLKARKSILKDSTFDKSSASITNDIDDKDGEIYINVSNTSKKHLKARKSILKDSTFDKSISSIIAEDAKVEDVDLNISKKHLKSRKSIVKDTTFEKSNASITNEINTEKDMVTDLNVSNISNKQLRRRRSNVKDSTFDKSDNIINTTFEKDTENGDGSKTDSTFDKSSTKMFNDTFENDYESGSTGNRKEKKSSVNTTFDKTGKTDTTYEKDSSTSFDAFKKGALNRKSSIKDTNYGNTSRSITSFTNEDLEQDKNIISSSARKRKSIRRETIEKNDTDSDNVVNTTFEKEPSTDNVLIRKSPRLSKATSDIQTKLNTTFEKEFNESEKENQKSSLISSDNSSIMNKSDISRISITSDDTTENFENIVNTTAVLIESSIDDSRVSIHKEERPKPRTPEKQASLKPQTPLKREGTFTKDGPEVPTETEVETPTKPKSLVPAAGSTPYHATKSSRKKSIMNVTKSIEKGTRASVDPAPRLTRVMFCSPVDNPMMAAQEKRKIIKSNLKGSNKSFVFDESASTSRPGRKRSYTQSDADDGRAKRTRLTEDLQQSVDRLSRPRTASATPKLSVVTPKKATPSKAKPESKPSRTKLPNFAALHQKQFDKMESLDECQERRAKRAKQLLTPTAPPGLLERISPKNNAESPKKELAKPKEKTDTATKKLPTLESLRPGFTRFGYKLNLDVNPFSIPSKTENPTEKAKEKAVEPQKPNGILPRQGILPSLAGATSVKRREVAKLAVMREKSFTDKRNLNRNENRTIIKGVRTNRRFELQMKLRNIE